MMLRQEGMGRHRGGGKVCLNLSIAGLILFAGCEAEETVELEPQVISLSPRGQLIRLSMDLRGIHPSEEELLAIEGSPSLYSQYVDRYLEDPRFVERMSQVFNLSYLTRVERLYFDIEDGDELAQVDPLQLAQELGEEPLELLRHIIRNNLPYSDIVTAPFSYATPYVADYWHMDYPVGATGWQQVTYQDERPHAGVLSMSTFWARYPSMGGNANRHRANAISRIFLCDDFLTRPIVVNRTVVDQLAEDPEEAIRTNESCQSCHSSLDPLSGALFGFFKNEEIESLEQGRLYQPENERLWMSYSGRSPGYFGRPVANLKELGEELASDPRFAQCAVETVFEGLTQRHIQDEDWSEVDGYIQTFEDEALSIPSLVKAIVTHPNYLAQHVVGDDELGGRIASVRTASPEQMADTIEQITGYKWNFSGREGLKSQVNGLNVLAGGIDGVTVVEPSHIPAVGASFVLERLAQSAAYHVVQNDFDPNRVGDAKLLAYVTPDYDPESERTAFETQIRALYLRVTAMPLDADAIEVSELIELWQALHSVNGSSTEAWVGVVSAVLRDPQVLFY